MSYQYLLNRHLTRTVSLSSNLRTDSFFQKLNSLILRNGIISSNKIQNENGIGSENDSSCIYCKDTVEFDARIIIEASNSLDELMRKIILLSETNSDLLRKLNSSVVHSFSVMEIMMRQCAIKEDIDKFVLKNRKMIKFREFTACYYIYVSIYCSKKYSISKKMCSVMDISHEHDLEEEQLYANNN